MIFFHTNFTNFVISQYPFNYNNRNSSGLNVYTINSTCIFSVFFFCFYKQIQRVSLKIFSKEAVRTKTPL